MATRRWHVELDGRRRTVELQHGTWSGRMRLLVDDLVVADQNALLAIGYDRGADLTTMIEGHVLTASIRAVGSFWARYRYALFLDGVKTPGSDPVEPLPPLSVRPTLLGIVEAIIWAALLSAAARTLANGELIRAMLLLPGALVASLMLRRSDLPASWKVVGAVLVVAVWILAVVVFLPLSRRGVL